MNVNMKYPTIAALLGFTILTIALIGGQEQAQAERDDLQYKLEVNESRPTPTQTVRVTMPPKTVKVTLPPKVITRTVEVERTERASRSSVRRSVVGDAAILACIRKHESGNNYQRVNSTGTYRGAYQMSRVYSPTWAKRAGYGQWSSKTADKWPPAVQDAVAYNMGKGNRYAAWREYTSYNCPW